MVADAAGRAHRSPCPGVPRVQEALGDPPYRLARSAVRGARGAPVGVLEPAPPLVVVRHLLGRNAVRPPVARLLLGHVPDGCRLAYSVHLSLAARARAVRPRLRGSARAGRGGAVAQARPEGGAPPRGGG